MLYFIFTPTRVDNFCMSHILLLMRRNILFFGICIFCVLSAAFLFTDFAFAQPVSLDQNIAVESGLSSGDIVIIVARIIRAFFGLLGILAVGLVLYAGFLWMTAGGEEEKVVKAKKILMQAVIGLAIILSAFAIVSFIINALVSGINGSNNSSKGAGTYGPPPGFQGGGELGQTIEYVLPTPNAKDVSRDSGIVVQFKKPLVIDTILKNIKNPIATVLEGELNTQNIKIYQKKLGVQSALLVQDVNASVAFTLEAGGIKKPLLVMVPKNLMGSPNENIEYTVELGNGIQKDVPGSGKEPFFKNGLNYSWTFEVGTKVDLEPPKLLSAYPSSGTANNFRNAILTVNFSKAMMPNVILDAIIGGLSVRKKGDAAVIAGTWNVVNLAQSAEFIPAESCGKSACGDPFYCLPPNSEIEVYAKAAEIDAQKGAPKAIINSGLMSLNLNAFDGNGNGNAEGTSVDSKTWQFGVGNVVDTEGPTITTYAPSAAQSFVAPETSLITTFNEPIKLSSIGAVALEQPTKLAQWFYPTATDIDGSGNVVDGNGIVAATKIVLVHAPFLASTTSTIYSYMPRVDEKLLDRQNNCFVPAKTAECSGDPLVNGKNCCNTTQTTDEDLCTNKYKVGI